MTASGHRAVSKTPPAMPSARARFSLASRKNTSLSNINRVRHRISRAREACCCEIARRLMHRRHKLGSLLLHHHIDSTVAFHSPIQHGLNVLDIARAGPHGVLDFLDDPDNCRHACSSTCHGAWVPDNNNRRPPVGPVSCPYHPCISRHQPAPLSARGPLPGGGVGLKYSRPTPPLGHRRAQHAPAQPRAAHLFLPSALDALG